MVASFTRGVLKAATVNGLMQIKFHGGWATAARPMRAR